MECEVVHWSTRSRHTAPVESANGADFQMTVNIKKLIIDYDGRMNNITHCDLGGGNSFWQGILSCIRGTNSGMEEESILELILHNHVFTNAGCILRLQQAEFYWQVLRKNWAGEANGECRYDFTQGGCRRDRDGRERYDRYPRYVRSQLWLLFKMWHGFYEDSGRCLSADRLEIQLRQRLESIRLQSYIHSSQK